MRIIDADALIQELRNGTIITDDLYGMGIMAGNDHAMKKITETPTIEAEPVRHGPCPYCDAETNDFVPINQSVEYSGIEIALNRQGMLRVRVYESGQETFTTQDIVEIKYCPNCGCKMDKGE